MKLYHLLQGEIVNDPLDKSYFTLRTEDGTEYDISNYQGVFYERLAFYDEHERVYVVVHGDLSENSLMGLDVWPDTEVL